MMRFLLVVHALLESAGAMTLNIRDGCNNGGKVHKIDFVDFVGDSSSSHRTMSQSGCMLSVTSCFTVPGDGNRYATAAADGCSSIFGTDGWTTYWAPNLDTCNQWWSAITSAMDNDNMFTALEVTGGIMAPYILYSEPVNTCFPKSDISYSPCKGEFSSSMLQVVAINSDDANSCPSQPSPPPPSPPPSSPAPKPPPSSPAPSPPPPTPPPPLDQVIMTTTASGELAYYTETKRSKISASVASDVAVDASLVTTEVEQGSVILTSTIIVPQEIEATTVKSALETKWGTSALASEKLSLATGDTISVVAAPMLTINEAGGDSDDMSVAIIAGASVGGVIALIIIILVIWHCNRKRDDGQIPKIP